MLIKGDTRSLDNGSNERTLKGVCPVLGNNHSCEHSSQLGMNNNPKP